MSNRQNEINHVCFLIDGTRTFAIVNNVNAQKINDFAYSSGVPVLKDLIEATFVKRGIPYLSIALTTRSNALKRSESMKIIPNTLMSYITERWYKFYSENNIRVRIIGDIDLFCSTADNPEELRSNIRDIEKKTEKFNKYHLVFMVAYDTTYEYINFLSKNNEKDVEKLIRAYYGFPVPKVDFLIRTWRPRLSGCVPILVGEYSDIYLFSSPFQCFDLDALKTIESDYRNRIESKGGGFLYTNEDIAKIHVMKDKILTKKISIIGTKVGNAWLPINRD